MGVVHQLADELERISGEMGNLSHAALVAAAAHLLRQLQNQLDEKDAVRVAESLALLRRQAE